MAELLEQSTDVTAKQHSQNTVEQPEQSMPLLCRWLRLSLLRRSVRSHWNIFRKNKMGITGLVIIGFWGLMALAPSLFFATGLWSRGVYDPVTGLETDPPTRTMRMVERITDPRTEIERFC